LSIANNKVITTAGDLIVGADITVSNGRGISFAATGDGSGTKASEIFDDYEEGTFTPVFVGTTSTMTINSAVYTKVGNLVNVSMYISSISPATSGDIQYITGLPYALAASNHYAAGVIGYSDTGDVEGLGVLFDTNSSQLYFQRIDGSTAAAATRANLNSVKSSGLALIITGTYRAA